MKRPAIRAMIRNRLGDLNISAYEWTDAQLNDFIDRAILEYSQHFPLWGQATIESDDGSHEFDLPMGARSVLLVEYPASQSPRSSWSAGTGAIRIFPWWMGIMILEG